MAIKDYVVGLVTSAAGITEQQSQWLTKSLKWISKACQGAPITVMVSGINVSKKSCYGVHRSVSNKMWPPGVSVVFLPGLHGATRSEATQHRAGQLECSDEIWCMPCYGQSGRLSKTRPAMSFWFGVSGRRANIYKWVPPWVDAGELPKQPKKELPWISK